MLKPTALATNRQGFRNIKEATAGGQGRLFGSVGDSEKIPELGCTMPRLPAGQHRLGPLCGVLALLPHEASGGPSQLPVEDSSDGPNRAACGLAD
jgi:hypothetical protein